MKKYLILCTLSALVLLRFVDVEAQNTGLIFSHKLHSETVGAACTDCHAAVSESALPADNLLPDMEVCYTCHDREAECSLCHSDPDNMVAEPRIADYIARFPHAKHINEKTKCETCHAGIAASEKVAEQHLPGMATCSGCHDDLAKPGYCYDCHAKGETLTPATHRLDWSRSHGVQMQADKEECKLCHEENYCAVCHKRGNLDRRAHPLNFINNHGLLARGNKQECVACHEEADFCASCHRSQMVMPRSHASAAWATRRSGGAHARAARTQLEECIICHSEATSEPVCSQCHAGK